MNNKSEILNKVDLIIDYIKNTFEYKRVIELKEEINNNKDLMNKINEVRLMQQEYVKKNIEKKELNKKIKELNNIPIYNEYNRNLEIVNEKLDYIKEYLNDYFNEVLNENK